MCCAGSNTHNNDNPSGDGQAGDAGEGTGGTDRNNMVQMKDLSLNYPLPYEQTTLWAGATVKWIYSNNTNIKAQDLAINLASSGFYRYIVNNHSILYMIVYIVTR